jgi:hypothetical protein
MKYLPNFYFIIEYLYKYVHKIIIFEIVKRIFLTLKTVPNRHFEIYENNSNVFNASFK